MQLFFVSLAANFCCLSARLSCGSKNAPPKLICQTVLGFRTAENKPEDAWEGGPDDLTRSKCCTVPHAPFS